MELKRELFEIGKEKKKEVKCRAKNKHGLYIDKYIKNKKEIKYIDKYIYI